MRSRVISSYFTVLTVKPLFSIRWSTVYANVDGAFGRIFLAIFIAVFPTLGASDWGRAFEVDNEARRACAATFHR